MSKDARTAAWMIGAMVLLIAAIIFLPGRVAVGFRATNQLDPSPPARALESPDRAGSSTTSPDGPGRFRGTFAGEEFDLPGGSTLDLEEERSAEAKGAGVTSSSDDVLLNVDSSAPTVALEGTRGGGRDGARRGGAAASGGAMRYVGELTGGDNTQALAWFFGGVAMIAGAVLAVKVDRRLGIAVAAAGGGIIACAVVAKEFPEAYLVMLGLAVLGAGYTVLRMLRNAAAVRAAAESARQAAAEKDVTLNTLVTAIERIGDPEVYKQITEKVKTAAGPARDVVDAQVIAAKLRAKQV